MLSIFGKHFYTAVFKKLISAIFVRATFDRQLKVEIRLKKDISFRAENLRTNFGTNRAEEAPNRALISV